MDSLSPKAIVAQLIEIGAYKAGTAGRDILIRGFISGVFLGFATVLAFTVAAESGQSWLGALAFPVGFVMIVLLGMELITGNFATVPMAVWSRRIGPAALARNWGLAFAANLLGSLFFALAWVPIVTWLGHHPDTRLIERVIAVASKKTLYYQEIGAAGLALVFIKAALCNWLVTLGVVMGASSTSTIGRISAIWLPIFTFFALGLEHCVVNMFVIPAAMLLGAPISAADWWLWNQIPATLGNLAGGAFFTGYLLWYTYARNGVDGGDKLPQAH